MRLSLLSRIFISLCSLPLLADCTSITVGTSGVTDLVCNGRDWINAAPSRWLGWYWTSAVDTVPTTGLFTPTSTASADLGGGVFQQIASVSGVPIINTQMSASIAGSVMTQTWRVENVHSTNKYCPLYESVNIVWAGAVTTNQGLFRGAPYVANSLPLIFMADSTGSIGWRITSYGTKMQFGTLTTAISSSSLRWGTVDSGGSGFCLDPGDVQTVVMEYRFGDSADTILSSQKSFVDSYVSSNPINLADRRPIGAVFLSSTGSRSTNNPRGWISSLTSDLNDPNYSTKLASFQSAMLTMGDTIVSKVQSAGGQGVVIWDIEGQELDHASSYVCDPRLVDTMAPEMSGVVDAFYSKFRSAGMRYGHCIRPTEILAQVGSVSGPCDYGQYTGSGGNSANVVIKMGMSESIPYAGTAYYCKADGEWHPRDTTVSSVNDVADTITTAGDYYFNNDVIVMYSSGTMPGGLTTNQAYYVVNKSGIAFQVSLSIGGAAVNITSAGSGTITATAPRDQRNIQYDAALQSMIDKVTYARNRWGSTLFYVDTLSVRGITTLPSNVIQTLNSLFPDCVFFPEILANYENNEGEWMNSLPFKNSGAYSFYEVPATFYSASILSAAGKQYPASFNYLANVSLTGNKFNSTDRPAIIRGISQGSIGVFTAWFGTGWEPIVDVYSEAATTNATVAMTDSGQSRTFKSAPGTSFTYPVTARVYFADTANNLAASTTYCTRLATDFCYLAGVLQPTATLNLSTTPYYQIRYYNFAGNLVSNPGTYGTLQ